jgi:nucleotide-binding universal stress UspA family protein
VLAAIVPDLPPVPLVSHDGGEALAQWSQEEEADRRTYLEGVQGRISERHPSLSVDVQVESGSVAGTLTAVATEEDADLIALTTHGRGAWQRAWLGSVADALVRDARRPLLLLRGGDEASDLFADERSPSHVLVPLDGSAAALDILGPLTSLLPDRDGRVTLLRVIGEPFPLASTYLPHAMEEEAVTEQQKASAREHLLEVAREWDPLGVRVDVEVIASGDIPQAVFSYAEREGVDLLAFSTRGRGGVGRFILGSIADKLIRGSELPVLTVRRTRGDGGGN